MADYFVDRSVEHPGRVTIEPAEGTSFGGASIDENGVVTFNSGSSGGFTAEIERNEGEVYEEGTPLNAEHLNEGINQMIGAVARSVVVSPASIKQLTNAVGREYVVVWTGAGTTGSRGVDYVWVADGVITSRNVSLTGTALLHYGGSDDYLVLENTASATTIHAMVIGAVTA